MNKYNEKCSIFNPINTIMYTLNFIETCNINGTHEMCIETLIEIHRIQSTLNNVILVYYNSPF
jgi:hypothetical protein